MPNNMIDFRDDYYLTGMAQEITPAQSFFKDRYFGEEEFFGQNKVLFEVEDNSGRKMALFVDEHAKSIETSRDGYEVFEVEPSLIAPARILTLDDLKKRGIGEPLLAGTDKEQRARAIQLKDMSQLDRRIAVREEWMAAQALKGYGFEMQEYVDANTKGQKKIVKFYEGSNPTSYTRADYWTTWAKMKADVQAMCDSLSEGGHPATDLVLGSEVWAAVQTFTELNTLLDNRRIEVGNIREEIMAPGVSFAGRLDFGGYILNIIVVHETYIDDNGQSQKMFDSKAAMVISPNCGKTLYGAVVQIPYGETEFVSFDGKRVPKIIIDQPNDIRKIRLASRPLTVPKAVAPWRYAAGVIAD